jgi:hypothetical protein
MAIVIVEMFRIVFVNEIMEIATVRIPRIAFAMEIMVHVSELLLH